MTIQSVTAPGKVMIAGEYAVLFGGLSLVGAIKRDAIASFKPGEGLDFFVRMTKAHENDRANKLFLACLRSARSLGLEPRSGSYHVDTSAFYNSKTHEKLGIGSSAAATVALCKLILLQNQSYTLDSLFRLALLAHRDFSEALGSGADIAAGVFAELIEFSLAKEEPIIKPISIPWWPELIFVDTLRAQNTRSFVGEVLLFAKRDPQAIADFKARSDFFSAQLPRLFGLKLAQALSELYALMKDLGDRCDLDIVSLEHQKINELARSLGGAAKPSGAGGGDLCLAWVPLAKRANFLRNLAQLGFPTLSLL